MPVYRPAVERFADKFVKTDEGCWEWTGAVANGYGYFRTGQGRRTTTAHRWSYENFVGHVPAGLHIDHLCRNRICVNPMHLEAVTQPENNRRKDVALGSGKYAETCKRGHAFTPENTAIYGGRRSCISCRHARRGTKPRPNPSLT